MCRLASGGLAAALALVCVLPASAQFGGSSLVRLADYQRPAAAAADHQPATEDSNRLMEILIQLAWLGDPATFPYVLEAHVENQVVHVRGFVPHRAVRDQVLALARLHCPLRVVDELIERPQPVVRPARVPALQVQKTALALLSASPPFANYYFQAQCDGSGRLLLTGFVRSFEEKLALSQKMRRIPGCACVINMAQVTADMPSATIQQASAVVATIVDGGIPQSPAPPAPAPVAAAPSAATAQPQENPAYVVGTWRRWQGTPSTTPNRQTITSTATCTCQQPTAPVRSCPTCIPAGSPQYGQVPQVMITSPYRGTANAVRASDPPLVSTVSERAVTMPRATTAASQKQLLMPGSSDVTTEPVSLPPLATPALTPHATVSTSVFARPASPYGTVQTASMLAMNPTVTHGVIYVPEDQEEDFNTKDLDVKQAGMRAIPEKTARREAAAMPGLATVVIPDDSAETPAPGPWKAHREVSSPEAAATSPLSEAVARNCGLDPGAVKVDLKDDKKLDIYVRAATLAEANALARQIMNLPQLLPYHVSVYVRLK
jgi:hypothetical protein